MINFKSIFKNIGANGLTVGFNTVFQFISVPIFVTYWGVDLYSDWLVLSSLTAYFMMTDIGLNSVTMNEIGISYGRNQKHRCNVLFNNNLFFIIVVFISVLSIILCLFSFVNISNLLMLESVSNFSSKLIIICLLIQAFTGMTSGLYDSIYRATDRTAKGIMINNYVRFTESILLILGVLVELNLSIIIVIYIIPRFIGLFFKIIQTKKYFNLKISSTFFNVIEFKKIIIPAFSFLAFPIGNSIILQGFILLINFTLGNLSLVIYNTTRTLTNVVKLCVGILNNSVWPELTLLYGKSDWNSLKKLLRYCGAISFYFSVLASVFLFFTSELIYETWTNNVLDFNIVLMLCFLTTVITHTIWSSTSIILMSTNNHKKLSFYYLTTSLCSLLIGFILLKATNSINYLPLSLLIIDVVLIYIVMNQSLNIVGDTKSSFLKSIICFPLQYLQKLKKL